MALPTLKQLLDDPSRFDAHKEREGLNWKNRTEYERRWGYAKERMKRLDHLTFIENEASYYLYFQVPSESRGNTYDVVIHFYTSNESIVRESTLRNYNVRIFSNNPVFAFRFGHANFIQGLLIDFLADKLGRDILENRAEKYNPKDAIGFCHIFYFVGKFILDHPRYFDKTFLQNGALKFNPQRLYSLIKPLDQVIEEYKTNKDKTNNRKRFAEEDTMDTIKNKIEDLKSSASSKVEDFRKNIPKIPKGVRKILPKKSNVTNKTRSGVRRITAKKSNITR